MARTDRRAKRCCLTPTSRCTGPKSEGRGTYRFFTDAMDTEVQIRVKLTAELREAIASGQLFLMYQPQVDVRDRPDHRC